YPYCSDFAPPDICTLSLHDALPISINLIGSGVVLDPVVLKRECELVASFGVDLLKNLFISERTHLILPTHRALDKASELSKGNQDRKSTRLNSSHVKISYAVFCLKK